MFDPSNTYAFFDLDNLNLLPKNWVEQILDVADTHSYLRTLNGKSSTSREPKDSQPTEIFVVEGDIILQHLGWLYKLYSNELLQFACNNFNKKYEISKQVHSSININYLKGKDSRYELHVDTNPLTGILFATTHTEDEGGELVFQLDKKLINVFPKRGYFILFDARKIPHTVKALKRAGFRISIVMNYYFKGKEQTRPVDLDTYIYSRG